MSKDLNITRLCDAYGALLTEHRRELLRNYYDYDLSLTEIAENFGITRQAALCSIKQAEKQLFEYEKRLGLVARTDRIAAELELAIADMDEDAQAAKDRLSAVMDYLH